MGVTKARVILSLFHLISSIPELLSSLGAVESGTCSISGAACWSTGTDLCRNLDRSRLISVKIVEK